MSHPFRKFEQIVYSVEDGCAYIRINRPQALNAFTAALYQEIKDAVRLSDADNTIDIIVITGTDRAFATGGDLAEVLNKLEDPNPLALYAYDDTMPFETIKHCHKTTIAAINGICVAGGLALASVCDIQLAAQSATFGIPEARIGLASSLLPSLLFGKVSLSKLRYLFYTAKTIDADYAERIGMITEVVPDALLAARTREVVAEIRRTSPNARALYKEYLNRIVPVAANSDLYRSMKSPEATEGLKAFGEKRKADYHKKTKDRL